MTLLRFVSWKRTLTWPHHQNNDLLVLTDFFFSSTLVGRALYPLNCSVSFPAFNSLTSHSGLFHRDPACGPGMKTLLELTFLTKQMLLHSEFLGLSHSLSLLLFPPSLFLYIYFFLQSLIFSLMLPLLNLRLNTSVSSRVAYLDYRCLLAQWLEVSLSVTTAGFTELTL